MMVVITNEAKNISLTFLGGQEIAKMYGYEYTIKSADKYKELTNSLIWEYYSPEGFYSNATPDNYSTQAIATDGSRWQGNRLQAKTISFMFYPQLARIEGAPASPQAILNAILEADDEVRVDVYTDRKFTNYFYIEESSNSETGLISLTTSKNGNGIFWQIANGINIESYYIGSGTPYINKLLPQVLLQKNNAVFPIRIDVFTSVDVEPVIALNHNFGVGGDWDNLVFTNALGDQNFTYVNADNDFGIVIDCFNKTVTNEHGEDRTANFKGDFIVLRSGNNNISWKVDDHEYLPQDLLLTIKADGYSSTIE